MTSTETSKVNVYIGTSVSKADIFLAIIRSTEEQQAAHQCRSPLRKRNKSFKMHLFMAPLKMGEGTEEGGIQAPHWAPTAPGTRTRKMSSHHVCLWKSAGLHLESQKSTGNGDSALRGLHTALLALRPSTESTVGKVHGPRVKEIGGVTLGHVLGGTGMHRNFHQEWKRWQEPFSLSSFSLAGLSLALF